MVLSKMLPDQVGLVQVESLEGNNVKDVAAKVEELQKHGAQASGSRCCATALPVSLIKVWNSPIFSSTKA